MALKGTDVAFCAKVMTAGTRYGARPDGRLVKVNHNPGVNVAYRTSSYARSVGSMRGRSVQRMFYSTQR